MTKKNLLRKLKSMALATFMVSSLFTGMSNSRVTEAAPRFEPEPTGVRDFMSGEARQMVHGLQSPYVYPKPDTTAPVVHLSTLSTNLKSALPGDTVWIKVKVTDDNTGVQMVNLTLDNENGGYRKFKLTRPDQDGFYTVEFTVDAGTHHGKWTLSFLEAIDNNSNLTFHNSLSSDLSAADFSVNNPKADMTAPEAAIASLKVSQSTAIPGQTVKVGVQAADDKTKVESVQYYYINEHNAFKTVVSTSKSADGYYYADFNIDNNTHGGQWTLSNIRLVDSNGNNRSYSYYDLDLSKGDFKVNNDGADVDGPIVDLSTLSVSRRTAYPGDQVQVKVKVKDLDSGVDYVEFDLHNEMGGIYTAIDKTRDSAGYYSMNFIVYETTQLGKWYVNGISAYDNNGNFTGQWVSDLDLSQATFHVIESPHPENPVKAIYVNHDTAWNYQRIDGDVYVGPDAHLTVSDVTINGNLYILGSVESNYKLKAKNVYAKSFKTEGETTRAHGELLIAEGDYDFNLIQSNQPIPSIPVIVTSENQVTEKGILPSLDGGVLPIADLYIDGVKIPYNNNGTFELSNLNVGKKASVELKIVDVFGKSHITNFKLENPFLAAPSLVEIAGATRYLTANEISAKAYSTAKTAILVQGNNFPDALTAGPLAHALKAPILLTSQGELTPSTKDELTRLEVQNVIIMGGTIAISSKVEDAIKNMGISVERVQGSSRYETAINSANKLEAARGAFSSVMLASGSSFPDALAIGSVAARDGLPILLTDQAKLSKAMVDYLTAKNIKEVTIVGGTLVISTNVETELKNLGIKVTRLGGATRIKTATLVAEKYFDLNLRAFAVNGWSFADGLTAAPYAAKLNAPVLLVAKDQVEDVVLSHIKASTVREIYVVGGNLVVNSSVRARLLEAISLQ